MQFVDLEAVRRLIMEQLPSRARWYARETPVDWNFSHAASALRPARDQLGELAEVVLAELEGMHIFGEQLVAEGGGATKLIAVNAHDGTIWGIDLERDDAPFFNSAALAFVETFRLFDAALRAKSVPLDELAQRFEAIEPADCTRSEWRLLAEYLIESLAPAVTISEAEWDARFEALARSPTLAAECATYLKLGPPPEMDDYMPESLTEMIIAHGVDATRLDPELVEIGTMIIDEPDRDELRRRVLAYMKRGKALVRAILVAQRSLYGA